MRLGVEEEEGKKGDEDWKRLMYIDKKMGIRERQDTNGSNKLAGW